MPSPGKRSAAYDFDLEGERSVYTEKDFTMFREDDSGLPHRVADPKGTLEVDRKNRRVRLNVTISGVPCELNGVYSITKAQQSGSR